ncbi:MAG TPA: hypothetical protein VE444_07060 [Gaiellaceae bacterium]|nr:hypothetical protein [Gaiellaceae bacterium]
MLVAAAATAGSAEAQRRVAVLIVEGDQPAAVRSGGAVGLYVAGRGLYVSRDEALEALQADDLPQGPFPCGRLRRCPIEIFVSVPPLGAQRNTQRYEITIRGGDYGGLLVSESTQIAGLVAIEDIPETVRALEDGREPPISSRDDPVPRAGLAILDERLTDARAAQLPATVALTLALIALAGAAVLRRSAPLARAALLFAPLALLFPLAVAALHATGPFETTAAVLVALPVALLAGRVRGERFAIAIAGLVAVYGLVLAISPETNALSAIGPHPWNGGRFYGLTNQNETLLVAAALAAGAVFADLRTLTLAALCLVVFGASSIGADGGGLVVAAAAFAVLWWRLGRGSAAWLVGAAVAVAAVIALDAALGGSSHVVDAVRGGPGELWDAFSRRMRLSWSIVTSSVSQAAVFVAGLGLLAWFGSVRPRTAVVDAFLVATAVSLLVNDSPTKVLGYGAIMCGALRAWSVWDSRDAE